MTRLTSAATGDQTSHPGVYIVHLSGRFDLELSARLLRMIDARLLSTPPNSRLTRLLLIDLTDVTFMGSGVIATLRHARYICDRHSVRLALIGTDRPVAPASLRDRAELIRHQRFPTVEIALEAWASYFPSPTAMIPNIPQMRRSVDPSSLR